VSWPTVRLTDVCDIEGGTQPPKDRFRYEPTDGYVRMLQIQDFKSDDRAVFIPERVRMKTCVESDVLIARYGASIGRILRGKSGAYNVALVKTVPDEFRVERDFLFHVLCGPAFQSFVLNIGSRAAQAGFNKADLERFEFVLPPLAEQRRIAEVLDRAEALRAKRRAALAQLDELPQAIFLDMFGNPERNPKSFPLRPLGMLAENRDSLRVPVKESERDTRSGPYPYYGAVGIIDDIDDYLFEGPHLLISEDGKHLESRNRPVACLADGRFWVNNHAHVLRFNGAAELLFLAYALELRSLRSFVTGIDQFKLNRNSLDAIPVAVPPTALQIEFARRVTAVETLKTAHRASLAELDALFASLQHRAFRGEL
jgi:type I restriction enzyme S subunit